jgi:rhamnosyltransferase
MAVANNPPAVLGVVVTYYPNREFLLPLIERLGQQCREVLVVDNTPAGEDLMFAAAGETLMRAGNCRAVRLGRNAGIAHALNVGIDVACKEGFDYVLLSDQDSLPTEHMVAGLVAAACAMNARGKPVGAVGPLIRDLVTGIDYPFQAPMPGRLFYGHRYPTTGEPHVASSSIITSGKLIPASAIKEIGGMMEELFIDHVDVEWCHRARARGYEVIGTGDAVLCHRMGDQGMRVWYLGWRMMSEYGPVRLYYRFRNFVHLLKLPYIPVAWKVRAAWYWLGNLYGHVVFARNRTMNLRAVMAGILDGVIGRLGPCRRSWR